MKITEFLSYYSAISVVPRGTGRIGIIRAYFTVFGVLGAIGCVGLAARMLSPSSSQYLTSRGEGMLAFANVLLTTFRFLRTDHLLKYRRRSGAWLAATCFAVNIGGNLIRGGGSPVSVAISGIGLALVVSIWKELD